MAAVGAPEGQASTERCESAARTAPSVADPARNAHQYARFLLGCLEMSAIQRCSQGGQNEKRCVKSVAFFWIVSRIDVMVSWLPLNELLLRDSLGVHWCVHCRGLGVFF